MRSELVIRPLISEMVSHPFARKKAKGWGTQLSRARRCGNAGPSASLHSAQEISR
jgi:hypothetical protein